MAVRIRMKQLGRRHRPFYRICATDGRAPRDGKVLEELGSYDPMVPDVNARAILKAERIDYWLGVGAQPSDKVKVLIKKYGTDGTHLSQQQAALAELALRKPVPPPETPVVLPPAEEPVAEAPAVEEAPAAEAEPAAEEAPAEEQAPAAEEAPAAQEQPPTEDAPAAEEAAEQADEEKPSAETAE